jgi:hypothetical protein
MNSLPQSLWAQDFGTKFRGNLSTKLTTRRHVIKTGISIVTAVTRHCRLQELKNERKLKSKIPRLSDLLDVHVTRASMSNAVNRYCSAVAFWREYGGQPLSFHRRQQRSEEADDTPKKKSTGVTRSDRGVWGNP